MLRAICSFIHSWIFHTYMAILNGLWFCYRLKCEFSSFFRFSSFLQINMQRSMHEQMNLSIHAHIYLYRHYGFLFHGSDKEASNIYMQFRRTIFRTNGH